MAVSDYLIDCEMWRKAVDYHGHICPGLAIGYRVANSALEALQAVRADDEELVAVVENDSCSVDAISVLTGCTLGKGNLLYRDYGKQAYTFICRGSGWAVRVAVLAGDLTNSVSEEMRALRQKVLGGTASREERERFYACQLARAEKILLCPADSLLSVSKIQTEVPEKARLFDSYICASCGEMVMEPKARLKEGKIVCLPCADNYTRGW